MIFEEAWGQLITIIFETTSCDANVHIYDIYKVDSFKGGAHLQEPTQNFWVGASRDPFIKRHATLNEKAATKELPLINLSLPNGVHGHCDLTVAVCI